MTISEIYDLFKECNGVTTDSRFVHKDNMFFSLKGPNFNGNKYAKSAIEKGAKYAIVDDKEYAFDSQYIVVNDSLETLQKLSNYHRNISNIKVIGITGSNGKTTSKELINSVLKTSYNTVYTKGNLNNHIGVPLSMLEIKADSEIAIIEMGANHIGEIAFLCEICNPDFGYITNFGKAHIEGFGNENGVIKGKKELYDFIINKMGLIFLNNDDAKQKNILKDYDNKYCFGKTDADVTYSIESIEPEIELRVNEISIKSTLFGNYNAENIMAAVSIGKYFGIDLKKIKKGVSNYISSNNRSQIIQKSSNKIILDAYNANPSSMMLTIKYFEELSEKNKILILGDMFELGKDSMMYHKEILEYCKDLKVDKVYIVGELFFETDHYQNFNYSKNVNELISKNEISKITNSCILLKGSRGIELEKLIDYIS